MVVPPFKIFAFPAYPFSKDHPRPCVSSLKLRSILEAPRNTCSGNALGKAMIAIRVLSTRYARLSIESYARCTEECFVPADLPSFTTSSFPSYFSSRNNPKPSVSLLKLHWVSESPNSINSGNRFLGIMISIRLLIFRIAALNINKLFARQFRCFDLCGKLARAGSSAAAASRSDWPHPKILPVPLHGCITARRARRPSHHPRSRSA